MNIENAKGFSLVELMISLVLGTVVMAGVAQLFVANSEAYNLLEGQSRMQESGRISLDFIGRNVRLAGYRGCFSRNDELRSTVEVNNIPYEFDLRFAVAGYDAQGPGMWAPGLATVLPSTNSSGVDTNVFTTVGGDGAGAGIDLSQIVSGTDVITFRNLSQVEARLAAELLLETSNPSVSIGVGWNEFDKDHLVMIHDCEKAAIFRVTELLPNLAGAPSTSNQDLVIGHDMDDADATRNLTLQLSGSSNSFNTDAAVSAIESHTYFVAPGNGLNNAGSTPRSLWRKSGLQPPVELVEGVEDLQILYGVDTDNDQAPNQYLPANLVIDWRQLTTLIVTVVVNSIDDTGGTTMSSAGCPVPAGCAVDGLQRRTFTQTFQLRNHG